jgi:hypothetical protein
MLIYAEKIEANIKKKKIDNKNSPSKNKSIDGKIKNLYRSSTNGWRKGS